VSHQRTDSPPPIEITSRGTTGFISWKNWKAILIAIGFFTITTSGGNIVTGMLGIGGPKVSAEQFFQHEKKQEDGYKTMNDRVATCENAIVAIKDVLDAVATVQRTQVATERARELTMGIKDVELRERKFVDLFRKNMLLMSEKPPKNPCYDINCNTRED
jgi:hypothetical protein